MGALPARASARRRQRGRRGRRRGRRQGRRRASRRRLGPSQVIRGHDGGHQRSSRRRRSRRDAHIELGARRHVVPARPRCWDLALTMQLPDVPRHAHAPSMGQGGRGVHGHGGCTDAAAARTRRLHGRGGCTDAAAAKAAHRSTRANHASRTCSVALATRAGSIELDLNFLTPLARIHVLTVDIDTVIFRLECARPGVRRMSHMSSCTNSLLTPKVPSRAMLQKETRISSSSSLKILMLLFAPPFRGSSYAAIAARRASAGIFSIAAHAFLSCAQACPRATSASAHGLGRVHTHEKRARATAGVAQGSTRMGVAAASPHTEGDSKHARTWRAS